MERLIEAALFPGRFVSYNAAFDFARGLDDQPGALEAALGALEVRQRGASGIA